MQWESQEIVKHPKKHKWPFFTVFSVFGIKKVIMCYLVSIRCAIRLILLPLGRAYSRKSGINIFILLSEGK